MNSEIWLFMTRELQLAGDLACSPANHDRAGSALGSLKLDVDVAGDVGRPGKQRPGVREHPCGQEIPAAPGARRLNCLSPDLLGRDGSLQAAWQAPRQ